jgi:hypothetical protein
MFRISLPVAYLAIGALSLVLSQSANAQCRGGGGGMGGGRTGGPMAGGPMTGPMGNGYMGSSFMSGGPMVDGCLGGSFMGGGSGRSGVMMNNSWGQAQGNTAVQSNFTSQDATASSTTTSLNNPTTVLAHKDNLELSGKQVLLLEKMQKSGKQRAALSLTTAQRKHTWACSGDERTFQPGLPVPNRSSAPALLRQAASLR